MGIGFIGVGTGKLFLIKLVTIFNSWKKLSEFNQSSKKQENEYQVRENRIILQGWV